MFKSLYVYFKSRRILLAVLFIFIFTGAAFLAFNIDPIEDISKMIPVDDELERYNFASKHIKINDRIIVNIYSGSQDKETDELINFSDSLEAHINKNYSEHISIHRIYF